LTVDIYHPKWRAAADADLVKLDVREYAWDGRYGSAHVEGRCRLRRTDPWTLATYERVPLWGADEERVERATVRVRRDTLDTLRLKAKSRRRPLPATIPG
jgi:hypothetical protein